MLNVDLPFRAADLFDSRTGRSGSLEALSCIRVRLSIFTKGGDTRCRIRQIRHERKKPFAFSLQDYISK